MLVALLISLEASAQGVDSLRYFPTTTGASWTYESISGPFQIVVQPGVTIIGGTPTIDLRDVTDDVGAFFSAAADGVRLHRVTETNPKFGLAMLDFVPPQPVLPNPTASDTLVESNGQLQLTFTGLPTAFGTYSYASSFTVGPAETPAGFFCDVIVTDEQEVRSIFGETDTINVRTYLVRDLGIVGQESNGFEVMRLAGSSLPLPPDDADCDGVPDAQDLCPFFDETDPGADADENGIGDQCECGDQTGDGVVNVSDILAINEVIFGLQPASPLCDTNNDGLCNVEDILGANARIFGAPAYCDRYPPPAS